VIFAGLIGLLSMLLARETRDIDINA
jgi:hypothetical protein